MSPSSRRGWQSKSLQMTRSQADRLMTDRLVGQSELGNSALLYLVLQHLIFQRQECDLCGMNGVGKVKNIKHIGS